jgi:1-acyl-sn-glycerol-3-phosphate acyltransferase
VFGYHRITPMGAMFYRSGRMVCGLIKFQCIREVVIGSERADLDGGFLLACTHLSHLEPMVISCAVRRQVRWMAREEFYRPRWAAAVLNWGGAFPVDRFGYSLPAVRRAIGLAKSGNVVGVFPEGGVTQGPHSVMRGAPFKQGVCTVAIEARVPIIPVVVLGTEKLNRVGPWLPFRRGRVWMAFGESVSAPPRGRSRRMDRAEMSARLSDEFVRTYRGLLATTGLRDDQVP